MSVTGEPTTVALEVTVRYAMALPGAVGENATLIVHVPPSGTGVAALQVPPGAATNMEPVENVASIPVTGLPLELVRVTLIGALVAPTLVLGKMTVEGDTKTSAAPVPVRVTGDPPTGPPAVAVMLRPLGGAAVKVPTAVGLKATVMVQVLFAVKVVPQPPATRENGAGPTVIAIPLIAAPLDKVTVCVAVAPTATLPNDRDVGYTFADVERSPS